MGRHIKTQHNQQTLKNKQDLETQTDKTLTSFWAGVDGWQRRHPYEAGPGDDWGHWGRDSRGVRPRRRARPQCCGGKETVLAQWAPDSCPLMTFCGQHIETKTFNIVAEMIRGTHHQCDNESGMQSDLLDFPLNSIPSPSLLLGYHRIAPYVMRIPKKSRLLTSLKTTLTIHNVPRCSLTKVGAEMVKRQTIENLISEGY